MPSPANPKRLQVVDRVVVVLSAITAGANYFYTPCLPVRKRFVHWAEASGLNPDNPFYMVFSATGGKVELGGAPDLYDEDFYISIKGYVKDHVDTETKKERAIRDIRKAINDDSKSGVAGSLGTLCIEVAIEEPPETDNGYLSLEGFGFFDQRIRIRIDGDFGEL